jgi:hypothetical protein
MAEVSTFRCDECGKLKPDEPTQLAQHWYRVALAPGPRFIIIPWEYDLWKPDGVIELHLCGMGCAVKAMTKTMEQSG